MEEDAFVSAMKTMSARGWRRSEPVDLGVPEIPVMLGAAIHALEAKGVTLEQIASNANLPMDEVTIFVGAASDDRPKIEL